MPSYIFCKDFEVLHLLNQYPEKNCESLSYSIWQNASYMYIMHQTKFCNSYNETIMPTNMALENICQRTANVICHILQSLGAVYNHWTGLDWTGLDWIVLPVGKGRVEHNVYVEQPPTIVGVTEMCPWITIP